MDLMEQVREYVDRVMADHLDARHKTATKRWKPPTLQEMLAYQAQNKELACLNVRGIYQGYADGGWVDTNGKPVRNWKMKLRTLASYRMEAQKPEKAGRTMPLCACGCGREARVEAAGKWFATRECRQGVLGW